MLKIHTGGTWADLASGGSLQNVPGLGVASASDATNRLSVASPASLFSHDGAGHQMKVNKAAPADTASLLFQSGFSGRAEMGLAGNDDFSVKVSADGSTFVEALRVDAVTGRMAAPEGLTVTGTLTGTAVTQGAQDATAGRVMRVGDFGLGTPVGVAQPAAALNSATVPGQYGFGAAAANAPTALAGTVSVVRNGTAAIHQTATEDGSNRRWQRHSVDAGTNWSAWRPVYTTANIVGTVTEIAGAPTGAVIERGVNANGDFTRFADGTQICSLTESIGLSCTEAVGAIFRSTAEATWTFPAPFANSSTVAVSGGALVSARWLNVRRGSGTSAVFRHYSAQSSPTLIGSSLSAVGRWY